MRLRASLRSRLRADGARNLQFNKAPNNQRINQRPSDLSLSLSPTPSRQLHLEDPGHNNIFTSAVGHEATLAVVVLSLLPVLLEAKRSLDGGDDEVSPAASLSRQSKQKTASQPTN